MAEAMNMADEQSQQELGETAAEDALLQPYRRRDNLRAFAAILGDYAIIWGAIWGALWIRHPLVYFVAILIIASRQLALHNIMHCAAHQALFSQRQWNERLQFLYAYPNFEIIAEYRQAHFQHHRDYRDRENYPRDEMGLGQVSALRRTWVLFIRPFVGPGTWEFVKEAILLIAKKPRVAAPLCAYWLGVIALCVSLGVLPELFWFWVVPLVWLGPGLSLWGEVSDHFATRSGTRNHIGLFQSLLIGSHSLYHALHHRHPGVPFYFEDAANQALSRSGHQLETTYTFLDFLRCVYSRTDASA